VIGPVRSASVFTSSLGLRPALLSLSAQRPLGRLLQPIRLSLHSAHRKVVLAAGTLEHRLPALNRVFDLLPRVAQLLLPQLLLLCSGRFVKARYIYRDICPLCTTQVGCRVLRKTACDEAACGIFAREDIVATTSAIDPAAGSDVVDSAVERKVDRLIGIAAVVSEEFGISQRNRSLLQVIVSSMQPPNTARIQDLRSISSLVRVGQTMVASPRARSRW
jgi:hypothetical protein